jgi:hypothetical protein
VTFLSLLQSFRGEKRKVPTSHKSFSSHARETA